MWLLPTSPRALPCDDARHGGLPVGELGGELVVSSAADAEVCWVIRAAEATWDDVVVLQPGSALATSAVWALPGAAQSVAFEHGAAHGVREVTASTEGLQGLDGGRARAGRGGLWRVFASIRGFCVVARGGAGRSVRAIAGSGYTGAHAGRLLIRLVEAAASIIRLIEVAVSIIRLIEVAVGIIRLIEVAVGSSGGRR